MMESFLIKYHHFLSRRKNYTYTYENYSTSDGGKGFLNQRKDLVNGQRPMQKRSIWIDGKKYGNVLE